MADSACLWGSGKPAACGEICEAFMVKTIWSLIQTKTGWNSIPLGHSDLKKKYVEISILGNTLLKTQIPGL